MWSIDGLGLFAYALTLIQIGILLIFLTMEFLSYLKYRFITWFLVGVYGLFAFYGYQMLTGLKNRYLILIGVREASEVSAIWAWQQLGIALSLSLITYLLWTRNTDKIIRLPQKRGKI